MNRIRVNSSCYRRLREESSNESTCNAADDVGTAEPVFAVLVVVVVALVVVIWSERPSR